MRVIALLSATFICASLGQDYESNELNALATLLLSSRPEAAFQAFGAISKPIANHQGLTPSRAMQPKMEGYAPDLKTIKVIRDKTGMGIGACKKALTETEGDVDKAIEYMRQQGILKAGKRSGKSASEGAIYSYIHAGSKLGVMLELNCETDFVAKGDDFQNMLQQLAIQIVSIPELEYVSVPTIPPEIIAKEKAAEMKSDDLAGKPPEIAEKMVEGRMAKILKAKSLYDSKCAWDPDSTVEDYVKEKISKLGENMKVARFVRFTLGETSDPAEEEDED